MFNREKAIQELCAADFDYIMYCLGTGLLESYLKFGFVGYSNMTDAQLIQELKDQGISESFGENLEIDPTDQADSDSYFENMERAQYRDRMEQDAESRYEENLEIELDDYSHINE